MDKRKFTLAVIAGLLGFVSAQFSINFQFETVRISILWAPIFPMAIAIAYGYRYALVSSILGLSAFYPLYLWPENGYANLLTIFNLIGLYAYMGWCTDQRGREPRFWNRPALAAIPAIIANALLIYTLYPSLLDLNPAPWAPDAIKTLPDKVLLYMAIKGIPMYIFNLLLATVLVRISGMKKLLGLPITPLQRFNNRIFLATTVLGIVGWGIFVVMNSIFVLHSQAILRWPLEEYEVIAAMGWSMMASITAIILMDNFEYRLGVENQLKATQLSLETTNQNLDETVARRTEELKATMSALAQQEKVASLNALVARVAHEINTPLGVTITTVSFLEANLLTAKDELEGLCQKGPEGLDLFEDIFAAIQLVQTNLQRMDQLVQSFERYSTMKNASHPIAFDMRELVTSVFEIQQQSHQEKPASLAFQGPSLCEVTLDFAAIFQLFSVLISNSFTHAFENTPSHKHQIWVEVSLSPKTTIKYWDSGTNVPQSILPHIFTPFFTHKGLVGPSSLPGPSSQLNPKGMGLSLVYNTITKQLSGHIGVSLSEAGGLAYEVKL